MQNIPENLINCPVCGNAPIADNGFSPFESIYYVMCTNSKCRLFGDKFDDDDWNNDMREEIAKLVLRDF